MTTVHQVAVSGLAPVGEQALAVQQAASDERSARAWDTVADLHVIGPFAATWAKLHESTKPTIAAQCPV